MRRRSFLGLLASLPFVGKSLIDTLPPRKVPLISRLGTSDVDPLDAVTKADFDAAVTGFNWKEPCVVVARTHVSRWTTEIDGVKLEPGNKVLLISQRRASQNGVHVFDGEQLKPIGTEKSEAMFITDGVQGGDTVWVATEPHDYVQFSGPGEIT